MVVNIISAQYNGGLLPDIVLFTPRLLPTGNPFKQTHYYYHAGCCTTLFLLWFCFLSGVPA